VAGGAKLDSAVLRTTATTSVHIAGQIQSIVSGVDANLHGALLGGQWKISARLRRSAPAMNSGLG
jgi:hypothetical protein